MHEYLSLIDKHIRDKRGRMVPGWIIHSALVTKKALDIAADWMDRSEETVDLRLLEEMSMLHDIGIFETDVPEADLHGTDPYVSHLTHGHRILSGHGLAQHAEAARSHMNVPADEVEEQNLPLPVEDHVPRTVEEEILCLADYYYHKRFDRLFHERTDDEVREQLSGIDQAAVERFEALRSKYMD